jgi:hypothetical protein
MYGVFAFLLGVASQQQAVYESSAQSTCALEREVFCILDAGMEIEEQSEGGEQTIRIYAAHSPSQAATLSYATGCRASRAVSPWLVGYSPYDPEGGRIYLKLVFKVADECFLTVSAPSYLDRESNLLGLSIMLPIVRLCQERPCSGLRLLDIVPQRLRSHWFSRRP